MVIVMMGPAGAGKTTAGTELAVRLGWRFVDADAFHTPENVEKMARGTPLTDSDRAGWLSSLREVVLSSLERRDPLVLACSALTRAHRDALAGGLRHVRFVYLRTSRERLDQRLRSRTSHFATASLLDSQLEILEEPGPDEALVVDGAADVDTIVGHVRLEFGV